MKKIHISPGCIACGTCESLCPEIFQVDDMAQIKQSDDFNTYENLIREAADICPVQAIKIEEK